MLGRRARRGTGFRFFICVVSSFLGTGFRRFEKIKIKYFILFLDFWGLVSGAAQECFRILDFIYFICLLLLLLLLRRGTGFRGGPRIHSNTPPFGTASMGTWCRYANVNRSLLLLKISISRSLLTWYTGKYGYEVRVRQC